MTSSQKNMRGQAGFTLVELAIVMIIIGLLIAGVLKGQQLIGNAKVTAQVAQVKAIDAATSTFKDMYAALPGDMTNVTNRLPNCAAAPCNVAGGGDGNVGPVAGGGVTFNAAPAGEQVTYFVHLNAADLITGINPALLATWGGEFPAAKVNGGLHVGTLAGGAVPNNGLGIAAANVVGGLYLALHNTPAGAVANTGAFDANTAQRIDTKIDDGVPSSGNVFPAGAANCIAAGIYNENTQGNNCNLYIRIQG
jgi:prepilin-type N-terminal cleavage/methylation domain-containing protein